MEISEDLIKQYDNLVKKIVHRYYRNETIRYKYEFEDLEQIGKIGLMKAIENFNEEKSKFITFAYNFINYEILHFIREDKYFLAKRNNRAMTNYIYFENTLNHKSINSKYNKKLIDIIKYKEESFEEIENNILLKELSKDLNNDEKRIIYLKYYSEMTQCEISEMLNITQATVSRKLKSSILKMQKKLKEV